MGSKEGSSVPWLLRLVTLFVIVLGLIVALYIVNLGISFFVWVIVSICTMGLTIWWYRR